MVLMVSGIFYLPEEGLSYKVFSHAHVVSEDPSKKPRWMPNICQPEPFDTLATGSMNFLAERVIFNMDRDPSPWAQDERLVTEGY
jgi:hypothetical protein